MFPSTSSQETSGLSGNKTNCFPRNHTLSVKYCSSVGSIEHTFIDCRVSLKSYSQIISWFNHCQGTAITLSNAKIAFHEIHHETYVLSGPVRRTLHLLIILVKQYICFYKHLQKEQSLDELVNKPTTQWKSAKCTSM